MNQFDPHAYGPVFAPLLETNRRRGLGFGTPDRVVFGALEKLSTEKAFAHAQSEYGPRQPADGDMAACCVAAVWLVHDFLDESHTISQQIDTSSGSFWHGILHRREGDYSNAKYWFRHVGRHDVYEHLGQRAGEIAAERGNRVAVDKLTPEGEWDPHAFVDLCQSVVRGNSMHKDVCLAIQQVEWELLFDYCYQAAIGN